MRREAFRRTLRRSRRQPLGNAIDARPDLRVLRSYATFETATSLDDFDLFVRAEQPTPGCEFRAVPGDWPLARYEILVLGDDVIAAFRIVRCALNILRDGADRGVISRFRIIAGADLLRDSSATPWSAASARLFRGTIPCHA